MSWERNKTPVSSVIGNLAYSRQKSKYKEPYLTTTYRRLSCFHINVVHNLKDYSVNCVLISSSKKEKIKEAQILLEQHNVSIFSSGQFWICSDFSAIGVLEKK